MKAFLEFSEYLDSKELLRHAGENLPKVKIMYESRKYCKIPLLDELNSEDKKYISLKPKDKLEILWGYITEKDQHPIQINLISEGGKVMYFSWGDTKLQLFVEQTVCKI